MGFKKNMKASNESIKAQINAIYMYLKLESWKGINEKSAFHAPNELPSLNPLFRIMLIYIIMNLYSTLTAALFFQVYHLVVEDPKLWAAHQMLLQLLHAIL